MKLKHKNLEIRLATRNDAEYLCKYWHESGWNISLEDARERLDKGKEQHMIEIDERIIGDIHYGKVENNGAEIGIYIRDENEKGKGYGTVTMFVFTDALINTLGYDKILINTSVDNKSMRYISENKFGLIPILHENVYQQQSGTYESYVEYVLEKKDWKNKVDYEVIS